MKENEIKQLNQFDFQDALKETETFIKIGNK